MGTGGQPHLVHAGEQGLCGRRTGREQLGVLLQQLELQARRLHGQRQCDRGH